MGVSQYFLWSVVLGLLKPQFRTPPFVFRIWVVLEDFAQKEQIVFCSLIENCSLICHRAIVSIQLLTLFFTRCGRYSADCIMTIQFAFYLNFHQANDWTVFTVKEQVKKCGMNQWQCCTLLCGEGCMFHDVLFLNMAFQSMRLGKLTSTKRYRAYPSTISHAVKLTCTIDRIVRL